MTLTGDVASLEDSKIALMELSLLLEISALLEVASKSLVVEVGEAFLEKSLAEVALME